MKYYIIAGEASGDLHGAGLMRALRSCDPQAVFRFWGGEKMAAEGGTLAGDYREGAVMGVKEVLGKAGRFLHRLSVCKTDIAAWAPDAVILIDYPGFNLRIARFASRLGIKVFWYIAPKVWATREGRVRKLRRWVDRLFVIFPFEKDYFSRHGIDASYVGNPLVDITGRDTAVDETASPYIALLPGSRRMEVSHTMPVFLELEKKMASSPLKDYRLVVAAADSLDDAVYEEYLSGSSMELVRGNTYSVLKNAAAAVIDSGTASLEAALLSVPQVVVYAMDPLSYRLARLMLKTKYISLANIILDKPVFEELIQQDCNAARILAVLEKLVNDEECRSAMLEDYASLRRQLGEGGAAERAASEMVSCLKATIEE
ncbi:MAG: lipid-A-disaccharide synthase [Bacteroidales bacterium]|nr:lipid-A-disaccharide synthase [Bacteroidales bacterium]